MSTIGTIAAVVGITAGALSVGVTAASLAGAFDPKKPNSASSQAAIAKQIADDQKQLSSTQAEIDSTASSVNGAKAVTYISLGLGVLVLGGGAYLLFRKK